MALKGKQSEHASQDPRLTVFVQHLCEQEPNLYCRQTNANGVQKEQHVDQRFAGQLQQELRLSHKHLLSSLSIS